jgi:hypothetical protein
MAGGRKARPAEISPGELGLPVELSNEGVFFACAEIGRQIIVFFCNPLIAVVAPGFVADRIQLPRPTNPLTSLAAILTLRRPIRWKAIGSFCVALRAEPGDLALSVHPVVGICLAGQPCDFALFAIRVVGLYFPGVICNSDSPEGHFCFCHGALCGQWLQKKTALRLVSLFSLCSI